MKMRGGFVSNSSSCSFMVSNPRDAIVLFKLEFKKCISSLPYEFDDIDFALHGGKDDLEKICNAIEYGNISSLYDNNSEHELYGISLHGILNIPAKLLRKATSMVVSSEDYKDKNVIFIRLLRAFFTKNGIKTEDCGDTSSGIDGDDFMLELMRKALANDNIGEKKDEDKVQSEAIQ